MRSILVIFTFLCGVAQTNGVTCEQMESCSFDQSAFLKAQQDGDSAAVCGMLRPSVECMQKALADCESNPNSMLPPETLQQLKYSIGESSSKLAMFCPDKPAESGGSVDTMSVGTSGEDTGTDDSGSSGPPSTAACTEIGKCLMGFSSLNSAIVNKNFAKACGILKPSVTCLQSAVSDCEDKNLMEGEALEKVRSSMKDAKRLYKQHCDSYKISDQNEDDGDRNGSVLTNIASFVVLVTGLLMTLL